MKNIRTLLIAVSAVALFNVAHAQTSANAAASVAVTAPDANAPYSSDALVQKRQADSVAKAEYKARKKAAKKKMKAEKKEAKADMKEDKAVATDMRNTTMATDAAIVKSSGKPAEPTK